MLKKEFKRKDVERARNLIMGKTGKSTGIQIGYNKKEKEHKEGDVWVEGKKTWTIKSGIKQTLSKLDKIKKEVFTPLCCPNCGKVMKHHLDISNYKTHKKCHDCVIEFEHKLKIKGTKYYHEYINNLRVNNKMSVLVQTEAYLLDVVNASNNNYISEQGDIERWVGGVDKEKMTKEIKEAAIIGRKNLKKSQND